MRITATILGLFGILCLSAGVPVQAEEPFSKAVGAVTVGDVAKSDAIDVPFITWGGDVATFLANGGKDKTKEGTIFAKQGLKLNLVAGDDFIGQVKNYLQGKSPFLRGTISMLGQASEVLGKDPRTKPIVFLQLTWSAGDHLVSRDNCNTLNDLKGKKVALQKDGPHVGMLDEVLHTAKLTWKDIKVVWLDEVTGDKGPAALFRKDNTIDACFAITPDMAGLTGGLKKTGNGLDNTIKGAHVLVSTADMSRSIADVYACRKDFYDANKDLVNKFTAGYLKACEELVDLQKNYSAEKKDKDKLTKYKGILKMTQDIYGKTTIPDEVDADGLIADATFVGLPGNYSFFVDTSNLAGYPVKMKSALDLAVGEGYATARVELPAPGFDEAFYEKIKSLGDLKAEIKPKGAETIIKPGEDPFKDINIEKDTIAFFTIRFEADDPKFDPKPYEKDFQKVLQDASTYGHAVFAIRGHVDPTKTLRDLVIAGIEKKIIRREGMGKDAKYFLVKDGSALDLSNTKKVLEVIEKEDLAGAKEDPKATLMAARDLSNKRAQSVQNAIMAYADKNKIKIDVKQYKAEGVGIAEPVVGKPTSEEQAAQNRRVEFRILRVSPEKLAKKDFDF